MSKEISQTDLTPIEKLDKTLKYLFLNRHKKGVEITRTEIFEFINKELSDENIQLIHADDFEPILNKLEYHNYVRKFTAFGIDGYIITFDGIYFTQNGGFKKELEEKQKREKFQNMVSKLTLAFAAIALIISFIALFLKIVEE